MNETETKTKTEGENEMNEIIERLKSEKKDADKEWYEYGQAEGERFAQSASYSELQHVLNSEPYSNFELPGSDCNYHPSKNDVLGDYFDGLMENENKDLRFWANWEPFEKGWRESVEDFWNKVEDKI